MSLDGIEDFARRDEVTSGVEVTAQSGAPANIQSRIVSIDWAGSWGCPSGIRLAVSVVMSRLYSSEASGFPGQPNLFR